ncbi:hypothetical protein ACFL6P_02480 [Candidatus Latescibacterota bacterium]
MKKILTIVLTAAVMTALPAGISCAENTVPADFEILAGLCSTGIQSIIEQNAPESFEKSSKTAFISYAHGIGLAGKTKEHIEAALTETGFSIASGRSSSDFIFTISVTGARIILAENDGAYDRNAHLTIHLKCVDPSQKTVFAGGRSESYSDTIPKRSLRTTQNTGTFSRRLKRHLIRPSFNRIRIISLLIISGGLAYLAFE